MLIECLASRSQIKHGYGSHRQQPQNDNRSDVLDPFLIVREPSMMHVHGQPPSGYPCSKLTYHIYGSMTELEPVVYLFKRQSWYNPMICNDYWSSTSRPQCLTLRVFFIAFASLAASCSSERAQKEAAERKEIGRQLTAAYYSCVRTGSPRRRARP